MNKRINIKKIFVYLAILVFFLMFGACSTEEAPKVEFEIPVQLQDNKEAISIMEDMSEAVQKRNTITMQGFRYFLEDGGLSTFRTWEFSLKSLYSEYLIQECKDKAFELRDKLDIEQAILLDITLEDIENTTFEHSDSDAKKLLELQEKEGAVNTDSRPKKSILSLKKWEELSIQERDSIQAVYEKKFLEEQEMYEADVADDDTPPWWVIILFMILILAFSGAMLAFPIFIVVKLIRKFRNNKEEL